MEQGRPDPDVTAYIERSTDWHDELVALRPILLDAGLTEGLKWRKPCYSHDGANIAIAQEMKQFLALMFFKGALLDDPDGLLVDNGPNSRSAKRLEFRSVDDVHGRVDVVRAFVAEAVRNEEQGLDVGPAPELVLVEELQRRLDDDPALRVAFDDLTPGRRREFHLHVSGAKRASTRESRVEACVPLIRAGRGLRDRR